MTPTLVLALYGAVISTGVLAWNVGWAIRSSRSRVRLDLTPSYGRIRETDANGFMITIANPSAVKVTLFELMVWHEKRRVSDLRAFWNRHVRRRAPTEGWSGAFLRVEGYETPLALAPGEAIEFVAPLAVVTEATGGVATIRVSVRDGLMRRHFSPIAWR